MSETNNTALLKARQAHKEKIQWAELARDGIIDRLAVWGPMIIPLIPASLTLTAIGTRYHDLLHFPPWMSWSIGGAAGAGVEVFGIVANENYLDMKRYNQTLREGEEPAPEEDARKARNTYMAVVIGLMTTLEVIPALNTAFNGPNAISVISVLVSLFPLVFLAVLSAQVIIMRKQHTARLEARSEREMENAEQANREDEIVQLNNRVEQLTEQLTDANEQLNVVQSSAELNNQIEQLTREIEQLSKAIDQQDRTIKALELNKPVAQAVRPIVQQSDDQLYSDGDEVGGDIVRRRQQVLNILSEHMSLGVSELHKLLGGDDACSRGTLNNDLKALAENGLIHNADRKWHIGQAIGETPEPASFGTNGVAHA